MATITKTTVYKKSNNDQGDNKGILKATSTVEFDNGSYLKIRLYEDKDPTVSDLPSNLTAADSANAVTAVLAEFEVA